MLRALSARTKSFAAPCGDSCVEFLGRMEDYSTARIEVCVALRDQLAQLLQSRLLVLRQARARVPGFVCIVDAAGQAARSASTM